VVGFVLLGGFGLLAGTVGKDYLMQFVKPEAEAPTDDRVEKMLTAASELYTQGDLDAAKAQYDRASVLAENEPRVLLGLARLAAARADQEWLRLRLIDDEAQAVKDRVKAELARRTSKLDAAVQAIDKIPDETKRALAHTDAARIRGNIAAARQQVETSGFDVTDPEVAYVLAMLDVAEESPAWATVIERLRTALVSDGALGRVRAALVYALAASGDVAGARKQLDELAEARPHPLQEDLKAYVDRTAEEVPAEGEAEPIDIDEAKEEETDGDKPAAGSVDKTQASFEWYLHEAASSRRSGDLAGAKRRYERALQLRPNNVQAMVGLGTIARMQGNYAEAKKHFDNVLERSPNNSSALAGGANVRWMMGSRQAAVLLYSKVPAGSVYHAEAQRRIAEFNGRASSEAPSEEAPGSEATPGAGARDEAAPEKPEEPEPEGAKPKQDTAPALPKEPDDDPPKSGSDAPTPPAPDAPRASPPESEPQ
jgi:tetratricopeptide (TPR) repeat protein